MLTDPISDMLTRIRNAGAAGNTDVDFPFSRVKYEIVKILEREGYLEKVEKKNKDREIHVVLKRGPEGATLRHVARISKPSRRVYAPYNELPRVLNDLGIAIISTSQGLMTNKDARKRHLGGEVVCEVY